MKILKDLFKNPMALYFLMLILGILSGLSNFNFLHTFTTVISEVYIRIFKCLSTPIIALSIIVTLSTYAGSAMTRLWCKTVFYTLSTTIIAAATSCLLYLIIRPANINQVAIQSKTIVSQTSYLQYLKNLIPENFLTPFIDNQVIAVLMIGIIIGLAITQIPDQDSKQSVAQFFKGIHNVLFVITKWVVFTLPIGIFSFVSVAVLQIEQGVSIEGIGQYLLVIVLANLIQGLIILPLLLKLNSINPITVVKEMMPALSVAFFSKSSAGTLPITIDTVENKLNISPSISRFVLPLCTTINMNGCAVFIFTTVIYVMQNNGIEINCISMICWVLIATIAAIGNAGVPMGCFLLSASLLSSMNMPIVLLGLILPFYSLIDMIETTLNVWSDSCVVTVINKSELCTD